MKHILIYFLFCLVSYSGLAHEVIFGKVLNSKSKEPLQGANVVIKDTSEGTVTDMFGNFHIETEHILVVLVISYVGYVTKAITIESVPINLIVNLEPKPLELSEITVSSENSSNIQSLNKISKIDIEKRPVRSSQDILKFLKRVKNILSIN